MSNLPIVYCLNYYYLAPLGEQAKPMTPPLSQEIQGRGTPPKQPPYSQV